MVDLDSNTYWQRKATYENLSRTIPNFKNLKAGEASQYFDEEGELHFEVRVSSDSFKSSYGKIIDYMQGELTSKPSSEIIMDSTPYEVATYLAFAILDAYARLTVDRGLNEIFNDTNKVELIDHKTGEIHQFTGSVENEQLKFDVSYNKDSDFEVSNRGILKYAKGENHNTKFEDFLGKLSPDFKSRFEHEKEELAIS